MENLVILIIALDVLFSCLYIASLIKRNRLKKQYNHQKALVSVLRHRLGDKEDNSKYFKLSELKEINVWSGKAVNDIYEEKKRLNHFANTGFYQPIVDNTDPNNPPRGISNSSLLGMPHNKGEKIINQLQEALVELGKVFPERDLLHDYISYSLNLIKGVIFPNVSSWTPYDIKIQLSHPPKYGKYFVCRKDGKVHWETWNGSGWAYNHKSIKYYAEIELPEEFKN